MIRIVTDSTADVPVEIREKYGIEVLPLRIMISGNEYYDGRDINCEKLFSLVEDSGDFPKTSAVNIAEAEDLFESLTADGDEVIALSLSSALSSSYSVMCMAAKGCQHPERISVIDTKNLCMGILALVMQTVKMIEQGLTREQTVKNIEEMRSKVRTTFVLDTMEYLARGGRCSSLVSAAGDVLSLHPGIKVCEDGSLKMYHMFRGRNGHVKDKYVSDFLNEPENIRDDCLYVADSGISETEVERLCEVSESLNHFDSYLKTKAGCVISSHCGPGCFGLAYIEK